LFFGEFARKKLKSLDSLWQQAEERLLRGDPFGAGFSMARTGRHQNPGEYGPDCGRKSLRVNEPEEDAAICSADRDDNGVGRGRTRNRHPICAQAGTGRIGLGQQAPFRVGRRPAERPLLEKPQLWIDS
jgi:hypothetical protein